MASVDRGDRRSAARYSRPPRSPTPRRYGRLRQMAAQTDEIRFDGQAILVTGAGARAGATALALLRARAEHRWSSPTMVRPGVGGAAKGGANLDQGLADGVAGNSGGRRQGGCLRRRSVARGRRRGGGRRQSRRLWQDRRLGPFCQLLSRSQTAGSARDPRSGPGDEGQRLCRSVDGPCCLAAYGRAGLREDCLRRLRRRLRGAGQCRLLRGQGGADRHDALPRGRRLAARHIGKRRRPSRR